MSARAFVAIAIAAACSRSDPSVAPDPASAPAPAPAPTPSPYGDSTCGACTKAHCGGSIPDGQWICIRDESGKVTSLIVN